MNLNLNPFAALSWSWRALRGHSVTFAVLFALGVLGVSVIGEFRGALGRLGAPWYAWLLVPIFAIAYFAKKEMEWLPELKQRKRWARGLFFGSILIAILWAKYGPRRTAATSSDGSVSAVPIKISPPIS